MHFGDEPSDWAILSMVGSVHGRDCETQSEIKRRAYAPKAARKPLEELSERELAAAYNQSAQLIAETGSVMSGPINRQTVNVC